MITIRLNGENPVSTRFAISPVWELMTSYSLLSCHAERFPLYHDWITEAKNHIGDIEFPYLEALFKSPRFFPDFLTPPSTRPLMNIYDEIDGIREAPFNIIHRDICTIREKENNLTPADNMLLQDFLEQPDKTLERLIEEIELYWCLTLAPHWSRMQEILEGDILYRAKQLALGGAEMVFSDLDPTISYQDFEVILNKRRGEDQVVESHIVMLIPLIFSCHSPFSLTSPEWCPTLSYQPRGWGMWRMAGQLPPNDALELTLGAGKAKLLQSLAHPASTGELAYRLNVTAGAISQHLARMSQAGLVTSTQNGKRVFHQLTQRGELLLSIFNEA